MNSQIRNLLSRKTKITLAKFYIKSAAGIKFAQAQIGQNLRGLNKNNFFKRIFVNVHDSVQG